MVADVGVDLVGELLVVQAQGQAVADDLVQGFGCGDALQVRQVGGEGVEDGVSHGRGLVVQEAT